MARRQGWWGRLTGGLRAYPCTVLAVVLLVVLAVPFLRKLDGQWSDVYLRAAGRLQAGQDIYTFPTNYLYPPVMAWLTIPVTALPAWTAHLAWYLVSALCAVGLWYWSWRLSGGGRLQGPGVPRAEQLVAIL
ncbi:MAG: DUF2029 domain-containing protein, partial [Gemmataceae bacterium]|nr:DUF2029 domain-containing protein [Gemmataceae bacterium]